MIKIHQKNLCENCFAETREACCPVCGYQSGIPVEKQLLPPGSVLDGRYVVGKALSKGLMGTTYLGYDAEKDRTVSIEEFFPQEDITGIKVAREENGTGLVCRNEEAAARFETSLKAYGEEIRVCTGFSHPNIRSISRCFDENNTSYTVSDWEGSTTLLSYMAEQGGTVSTEDGVRLLLALSSALKTIHGAGKVHGNITGESVFYTGEEDFVRLGGFGAERLLPYQVRKILAENGNESVVPSPYVPMEQYTGEGEIGPWTDIYSMGAVVYHALTGKTFPNPLKRLRQKEPIPLDKAGMEPGLYRILAKCMAVYPKRRYQTVALLLRDLEAYVKENSKAEAEDLTPAAPVMPKPIAPSAPLFIPSAPIQQTEEKPKKKTGLVIAAALLLVILLGLAGGLIVYFTKGAGGSTYEDPNAPGEMLTVEQLYEKGNAFYYGDGVSQDYDLAFLYYGMAAAEEHPAALCARGRCHLLGHGTQVNEDAAFNHFTKAAELGDTEALAMVGLCYLYGYGTQVDYATAHAYLNQAVEADNATGYFLWGECYDQGLGVSQDVNQAFAYYKEAADRRHSGAMRMVAVCYLYGIGTEEDMEKAVEYLTMAANAGDPEAAYLLGMMYYEGSMLRRDMGKACEFLSISAMGGNQESMLLVARMYEEGSDDLAKDYAESFGFYLLAAEAGSVDAMFAVGNFYAEALGVKQNYEKALEYYTMAAEQGHSGAMAAIGFLYLNGNGVETDEAEAMRWFKKAVDAGSYDALLILADCYLYGKGTERNPEAAFQCYRQAYEMDGSEVCMMAMQTICEMYMNGQGGVSMDRKKAFDLFTDLAKTYNDPESMNWLGYMYGTGAGGVGVDEVKAFQWYKKAADAGLAAAMNNVAVCYREGRGVAVNEALANEYFMKGSEAGNKEYYRLKRSIIDMTINAGGEG